MRDRFNIRSDQASAFVSVTYDATDDQWYYLADAVLIAFTPEPYDHLIATVDFEADTVTMLDGAQDPVAGVSAGVISSDIKILPNMWRGSPNAGEFMVAGTHMTIDFATERASLTRDDLGKGIVGMDLRIMGFLWAINPAIWNFTSSNGTGVKTLANPRLRETGCRRRTIALCSNRPIAWHRAPPCQMGHWGHPMARVGPVLGCSMTTAHSGPAMTVAAMPTIAPMTHQSYAWT